MKGIMFTADLLPLVMSGAKTQTRRLVKGMAPGQYVKASLHNWHACEGPPTRSVSIIKPRYRPGEVVYVKEPWFVPRCPYCDEGIEDETCLCGQVYYKDRTAEMGLPTSGVKWKSSLFMPAWAARTWIRILDVRCERVGDISRYDALSEGVAELRPCVEPTMPTAKPDPVVEFSGLWDSIAKPGSRWADGPWVWAYTFERCGQDGGR